MFLRQNVCLVIILPCIFSLDAENATSSNMQNERHSWKSEILMSAEELFAVLC